MVYEIVVYYYNLLQKMEVKTWSVNWSNNDKILVACISI